MEALVTRLENKLRSGWRAMVRSVKDENSLADLAAKIATDDISALIGGLDEAAVHFTADIGGGYVQAAQRAAREIDAIVDPAFRFNIADPDSAEWMRQASENVVGPLVEEQQDVARRVVYYGRQRGLSPAEIAEEVRDSIGLNAAQVDQIERYRAVLERGDYARARTYELRDARYDSSLARASATDAPLGEERVDSMVGRYRSAWVARRADDVALTEAQNAANAGVMESYWQAVEAGFVDASQIECVWITRHDPHVRRSHRFMHGQVRAFGDPFISGDGNELRYPGDEDAPAADTVNCRCILIVRIRGALDVSSD
jgi:hypothetical protein